MEQKNKLKLNSGGLLVFILTVGVFGIINTEMGVVGILPLIAETFKVSVPQAGWTVSVFALVVAASAPITPLLFSGVNRKKVMLLALGLFTLSNIISMLTTNFYSIINCTDTSRFPSSGICIHGFYGSCSISKQGKSSKGGLKGLCRCICRYGAGGSGDQLYSQ